MSASFAIPTDHIDQRSQTISELDRSSNIRHLCLFDQNEHVAGVVLADPNTLNSMNQEKFECLAIVETTLSRMDPNPSWDDAPLDDQCSKWDFYDSCYQDWGGGSFSAVALSTVFILGVDRWTHMVTCTNPQWQSQCGMKSIGPTRLSRRHFTLWKTAGRM